MEEPKAQKDVHQQAKMNRPVWDCESSLYDSFELKSFERQLDSAISSRSLSMPHLTDGRIALRQPEAQPQQQQPPQSHQTLSTSKRTSKISRSLYKFIRSVFKTNRHTHANVPAYQTAGSLRSSSERFFVVFDDRRRNGEVLTTIPEGPEFDIGLSPNTRSLATRTSSDRFSTTTISSIGISCA